MDRIVTLTLNPALDASTEVPALMPDAKLRCGPVRREAGGGGVNVARAIAALGGAALALHAVGGPTGAIIEACLEQEGVPQRPLFVSGTTRENLAVLDRSSGERFRFVLPGPPMSRSEWRRCLDAAVAAAEGPYLVASGSLPPGVPADFYSRLASALEPWGRGFSWTAAARPSARRSQAVSTSSSRTTASSTSSWRGSRPTPSASAARPARRGWPRRGGDRHARLAWGPPRVGHRARADPGAAGVPRRKPRGGGDSFMAGLALALASGRELADAAPSAWPRPPPRS